MKRKWVRTEARKEELLAAALPLAEQGGYEKVSRNMVGRAAGVTGPVVSYHFGTVGQFRRDLMRYAVRCECLRVVAQGLIANDPQAMKAPEELRKRALGSLG